MSGRLAAAALAALLAGPSLAQDPFETPFAWETVELSSLALDEGRRSVLMESLLVFPASPEGPLAGFRGRCLRAVEEDTRGGRYRATGLCALTGPGGDRVVGRIADGAGGPGELAEGQGEWEGGTGRLAGASGRFAFSLVAYGTQAAGTARGTGRLWGDPPGPAAADAPLIDPGWP